MDNKTNRYIEVSYQLFDITDGQKNMVEETTADHPLTFVSGQGLLLNEFERKLIGLEAGSKFDFELLPEQAFGVHSDERVVKLNKQIFYVDGRFDKDNVYQDAIIPLQDEGGNRFPGRVMEITDETVKIDLNHPMAGKTLNFRGEIIKNREATNEDVDRLTKNLPGHGEGCQCGGHGHQGGCCGGHHHGDGGCCGNHHHDGECCGNHYHD